MAKNKYVGHRYIPIFENGWDKTRTYEPLTFVYYEGKTYVSRQLVPTNIEIENNDYWAFFMDNAPQIFTPTFIGEWVDTTYDPLSIVVNNGNTYVSKQNVPVGTVLTDETYWLDLSNYYNQLFTDYETAEQERQQAESIRVENENQRNLTSVDEFVKLQDSIGGRNIVKSSNIVKHSNKDLRILTNTIDWLNNNVGETVTLSFKIKGTLGLKMNVSPYQQKVGLTLDFNNINITLTDNYINYSTTAMVVRNPIPTGYNKGEVIFIGVGDVSFDVKDIKIEKGTQATPYTKAPEDYTTVSKEDYYNHVKMMNNFKDNQFNQLKQAVIALGGTI